MKKIYSLFCAIAIALGAKASAYSVTNVENYAEEVRDSNNIIVEPATGTTIEYRRKIMSRSSFFKDSIKGGSWLSMQASNAIMVACEDGTVYWQDPVSHYRKGSWIKGKKEGSTITFPAKQPVFADADYLYTVRWGLQKGTKFVVADDYSEDIILDIVNDSLILRGSTYMDFNEDSEHYFIGIFREKFSKLGTYSYYVYGDCQTNLYIPSRWPDLNLITPPVGMATEKLPYTALDDTGVNGDVKDSVLVGWDNDTVYIQGLCPHIPDGWVKGTLQAGTVTFKAPQYVGQFYFTDMWMLGCDNREEASDYHLKYDAESNYFVGTSDEYLLENVTDEWIASCFGSYTDLTIGTLTTDIKEPALRSARFSDKPVKTIENGQLRILRNDKRYTILGVGE